MITVEVFEMPGPDRNHSTKPISKSYPKDHELDEVQDDLMRRFGCCILVAPGVFCWIDGRRLHVLRLT
jgi:hypothetical protein